MEAKLETKCPKCEHVFLTTYEVSSPTSSEAQLSEVKDNLADAETNLKDAGDQLAYLKEEVERLQSQDYRTEIVKDFLNQDFEDADPVVKAELGRKLGLTKMFEEAELVEELTETAAEAEEPAPKLGIVYDDPKDEAAYRKVKNLPIWILQKEEA